LPGSRTKGIPTFELGGMGRGQKPNIFSTAFSEIKVVLLTPSPVSPGISPRQGALQIPLVGWDH
ncbi:MAG TPA: hypothetical protein VN828_25055, partial [Acidobacteriaceae bacterium]|nr:hypothetical protein [Acidobacteriaceae bacterium]